MYTIYMASCLANGKVYVGQTKTYFSKRQWAHLNRKDYNCFFHRALRKHGRDSFVWQTVAKVETKEQADNLERAWIILLRSRDRAFGYNITAGGGGSVGSPRSKESLRKQSASLRLAHAEGRFPYRGGWTRRHSDETRKRISEGLKRYNAA